MSRIYNGAFKVGVTFNIFVFIMLNLVTFVVAYREYYDTARLIRFSGEEIRWVFPYEWQYGLGVPVGFVLNVLIIAFFAFVFGFLFRFVSARLVQK